jgi:hypothetical protein
MSRVRFLSFLSCLSVLVAHTSLAQAPSATDDTTGLATAAASWLAPQLRRGERVAVTYGTQRGPSIRPSVTTREAARAAAAPLHAAVVRGDSARSCGATGCRLGPFDGIVSIHVQSMTSTTGVVFIAVQRPSHLARVPISTRGWVLEFAFRNGAWAFHRVRSTMTT